MEIKNMKNDNLKDISLDLVNLLLYENTILRKKEKKIKLTKKEQVFDKFIIPPSLVIRSIISRKGDEKI